MNDLKYKDSNASLNFAKMVRCCIEIVLKNFYFQSRWKSKLQTCVEIFVYVEFTASKITCSRISELSVRIVQVTKFEIDFEIENIFATTTVLPRCTSKFPQTAFHTSFRGSSSIFIDKLFLQFYALVELCRNLSRIAFLRI